MIELIGITKAFPVRGIVLDNLSLKVQQGSSTAISGPSGSGKTTLLNILGMLERPDSGTILFEEEDITGQGSEESAIHRNRNLGFIFQEHLLLPHLTVMENIILPTLATERGEDQEELRKYIISLAERTGIEGILNKRPYHISGGEAQRASFVRALVNKPGLILADEPTGSLDKKNSEILTSLLLELTAETGTTLIAVTHSEMLASAMKNRFELDNGRLTAL